ncbi:MAG: hypothetical protein ACKVS6_10085 [Planctomycetota bacterium]
MNPAALVAISAVVAVGASVAIVKLLPPSPAAEPYDANRVANAEKLLASMDARFASLEKKLESLQMQPAVANAPPPRVSDKDIEDAVTRILANRPADAPVALDSSAKKDTKKDTKKEFTDLFAKLTDPDGSWESRERIWKQLQEAGMMDQAIEALRKRAEDSQGSADAQYELAQAYIAKLQTVKDNSEMGKYAMLADQMFDKALTVDPQHWEARFSKAISLSFWPAFTGKPAEAVTQLETLRKQQEDRGGSNPEYAKTYQILGNLYQQQGKPDQAQEIWKKGASLFPNDAELKQKLGQK